MTQIFGDFIDELPPSQEYLVVGFSPSSIPLKQRWRNNGLSADFLADYFTTFFPSCERFQTEIDRQAEIKNAVSYIANELLENAMKFSDDTAQQPISIGLQLHEDRLIFLTTNSLSSQSLKKFQAFLDELATSDPSELYIRHLESGAQDENHTTSGLGILTMMNDYLAKIGWKFDTIKEDPEVITVTTMVQLEV